MSIPLTAHDTPKETSDVQLAQPEQPGITPIKTLSDSIDYTAFSAITTRAIGEHDVYIKEAMVKWRPTTFYGSAKNGLWDKGVVTFTRNLSKHNKKYLEFLAKELESKNLGTIVIAETVATYLPPKELPSSIAQTSTIQKETKEELLTELELTVPLTRKEFLELASTLTRNRHLLKIAERLWDSEEKGIGKDEGANEKFLGTLKEKLESGNYGTIAIYGTVSARLLVTRAT